MSIYIFCCRKIVCETADRLPLFNGIDVNGHNDGKGDKPSHFSSFPSPLAEALSLNDDNPVSDTANSSMDTKENNNPLDFRGDNSLSQQSLPFGGAVIQPEQGAGDVTSGESESAQSSNVQQEASTTQQIHSDTTPQGINVTTETTAQLDTTSEFITTSETPSESTSESTPSQASSSEDTSKKTDNDSTTFSDGSTKSTHNKAHVTSSVYSVNVTGSKHSITSETGLPGTETITVIEFTRKQYLNSSTITTLEDPPHVQTQSESTDSASQSDANNMESSTETSIEKDTNLTSLVSTTSEASTDVNTITSDNEASAQLSTQDNPTTALDTEVSDSDSADKSVSNKSVDILQSDAGDNVSSSLSHSESAPPTSSKVDSVTAEVTSANLSSNNSESISSQCTESVTVPCEATESCVDSSTHIQNEPPGNDKKPVLTQEQDATQQETQGNTLNKK